MALVVAWFHELNSAVLIWRWSRGVTRPPCSNARRARDGAMRYMYDATTTRGVVSQAATAAAAQPFATSVASASAASAFANAAAESTIATSASTETNVQLFAQDQRLARISTAGLPPP